MRVVIIGGGIAGVSAAIELANRGYKVTIIEAKGGLLEGSSNSMSRRIGVGFHYSDAVTAMGYLHASVRVLRKYPGIVVGEKKGLSFSHPYRRGHYLVVKGTEEKAWRIGALHETLRAEYKRMIDEDPANKVFGEPDSFSQQLTHAELRALPVDTRRVLTGYKTKEQNVCWDAFKEYLISLTRHENIKVFKLSEVVDVKRSKDTLFGFTLVYKTKFRTRSARPPKKSPLGAATPKPRDRSFSDPEPASSKSPMLSETEVEKRLDAELVINASWYNIEHLNRKLGYKMPPKSRTNRIKAVVEIKLPTKLTSLVPPLPSMFFCFGPHCSLTNLGNGNALITYEPKSRLGECMEESLPDKKKKYLTDKVTEIDRERIGRSILLGATKYIPLLKGSDIKKVNFGCVRVLADTPEEAALKKEISKAIPTAKAFRFSRRRKLGVEALMLNWIVNPAMKFWYFIFNVEQVARLVDYHVAQTQVAHNLLIRMTIAYTEKHSKAPDGVMRTKMVAAIVAKFKTPAISAVYYPTVRKQLALKLNVLQALSDHLNDCMRDRVGSFLDDSLTFPLSRENLSRENFWALKQRLAEVERLLDSIKRTSDDLAHLNEAESDPILKPVTLASLVKSISTFYTMIANLRGKLVISKSVLQKGITDMCFTLGELSTQCSLLLKQNKLESEVRRASRSRIAGMGRKKRFLKTAFLDSLIKDVEDSKERPDDMIGKGEATSYTP